MEKILEKICPECNKKITSLHQSQLEYNFKIHMMTHEKKEENSQLPLPERKGLVSDESQRKSSES